MLVGKTVRMVEIARMRETVEMVMPCRRAAMGMGCMMVDGMFGTEPY